MGGPVIREALELGLQAWRTTAVRAKFHAAFEALDRLEGNYGALIARQQAIETEGRRLTKDGWRDDDGHEWCLWLGEMVECPRCAFTYGSDHYDHGSDGDSYTCPNCQVDQIEKEIRQRLDAVIVSHGIGEMSELLAQLLAVVTGGVSVGR